jgi:fumarate reductase flavoprotein subunit
VNQAGQRFVSESLGYSGCTTEVRAQEGALAFALFDARTHEYMRTNVPEYADLDERGGVKTGHDLDALGAGFGIPAGALSATLAAYHAGIRAGDDRFGRTAFGEAPLQPPYALVRVTAGLFHTQGGLDVDTNAQPVRADGTAIANLYAVGGSAVGVSGAEGGKGYVSANGLLAALGLGRVAGRHAARSL